MAPSPLEDHTGEALAGALLWLAEHEGGLLVYLDDAESLQQPLGKGEVGAWKHPSIGAFWQALLAATKDLPRFALLASARYVPQGLAEAAWYALGVMREIDLVRLVRWWPVLGRLGADDVAWLAGRIDGHPRSLQWLDGLAREKAEKSSAPGRPFTGDLRREVIERVLPQRDAQLSEDLLLPRLIDAVGVETQSHLRRCAVLEEPSPWGAIVALEDAEGTGKHLARVGLLSAFEPPHGGEPLWAPHRMVAEAAGQPAEEDAVEAHRRVGTWFRAQWVQNEWALDLAGGAARHLCAAGDGNRAWEPAQQVVLARGIWGDTARRWRGSSASWRPVPAALSAAVRWRSRCSSGGEAVRHRSRPKPGCRRHSGSCASRINPSCWTSSAICTATRVASRKPRRL